jgi:hypothetical protein
MKNLHDLQGAYGAFRVSYLRGAFEFSTRN